MAQGFSGGLGFAGVFGAIIKVNQIGDRSPDPRSGMFKVHQENKNVSTHHVPHRGFVG